MEGKTVILSVLIMSLVMAQIQVEARPTTSCCPTTTARRCYNRCRAGPPICARNCGCIIVPANIGCPGWPKDILEKSGDAVNEYCKLGCASSVCSAMEALQNSDGSETVNGAVEQCAKACSTFCTKVSTAGVGTA